MRRHPAAAAAWNTFALPPMLMSSANRVSPTTTAARCTTTSAPLNTSMIAGSRTSALRHSTPSVEPAFTSIAITRSTAGSSRSAGVSARPRKPAAPVTATVFPLMSDPLPSLRGGEEGLDPLAEHQVAADLQRTLHEQLDVVLLSGDQSQERNQRGRERDLGARGATPRGGAGAVPDRDLVRVFV